MKETNIVRDKSFDFAIRIVKFSKYIYSKINYIEHPLIQQLVRSGTSIIANISEAEFAESKDDFKHKLKIALKEANESKIWLNLLYKTDYINETQYNSIITDCIEIIKLLVKIIKSLNINN
jgi:four helix bundle protein